MAQRWETSGDQLRSAYQVEERRSAVFDWIRSRTATVKDSVSAHDILRHYGTPLRSSIDAEEQISCPFHGKDTKPSARIYPTSGQSASHVYCFTCQKNWDVFGLWRNFMNYGEEIKFATVLFEIERAFGIIPPEAPESVVIENRGPSEVEVEMTKLFAVCESRLLLAKDKYDVDKYLRTGQLLDRLYYAIEKQTMKPLQALEVLRQILDKIGERTRA